MFLVLSINWWYSIFFNFKKVGFDIYMYDVDGNSVFVKLIF